MTSDDPVIERGGFIPIVVIKLHERFRYRGLVGMVTIRIPAVASTRNG